MKHEHIKGLSNVPGSLAGCVLTMGNFDGVHRGHGRILSLARELAASNGGKVVAMTFDPPPDLVVRPADAPKRLMPHEEKVQMLIQAGADVVVTAKPDRAMLMMPACDFLRDIIVAKFSPRHIVEGENFFFGHGRAGTVEMLRQQGPALGFDTHVVEPVHTQFEGQSVRISSTLIRQMLHEGRVEIAADMLGRCFALSNTVVLGDQLGRVLEFPTANIQPGQQIVPCDGVYAGWGELAGEKFPAAISIGCKPTFGQHERFIEANLVGASGDFYGQAIRVEFLARLRDQWKFDSAEALKEQIAKDVQQVLKTVHKKTTAPGRLCES